MKRNLDSQCAVSFFSFQDIITSISGIMIFVAMLLVLDLTTSAFTPSEVESTSITRQEFEVSLSEAKARLSDVRLQLSSVLLRSGKLATKNRTEVSKTLAELRARLEKWEKVKDIRTERRKARERQLVKLLKNIRSMKGEMRTLALAKSKLERALRRRVVFALEGQAEHRKVVVIELSAADLKIRGLDAIAQPKLVRSGSEVIRRRKLAKVLAEFSPKTYDALIVIKPSAFENAETIVNYVRGLGYHTGFEPIEEERTVME